ncbi:hypothetical protein [Mucilaginibacter auburnensis]|uniref:Uncharacterized protein n=1 Tax=Mucilaginibacter auburnensis TaxID=1457233 RepID=A0A2H9VUG4_9SPHI|nr:hypothetical protein [Mucilaginibacter auburnensis]PJJ84448.1 hypothetical protein CLV57_1460 [Mucilaginibacter auburnensis]
MKNLKEQKTTVIILVIGLLIVSLTPIVNRYFHLADAFTGFLTGIGLMIECIALIKMQQIKKQNACGILKR